MLHSNNMCSQGILQKVFNFTENKLPKQQVSLHQKNPMYVKPLLHKLYQCFQQRKTESVIPHILQVRTAGKIGDRAGEVITLVGLFCIYTLFPLHR